MNMLLEWSFFISRGLTELELQRQKTWPMSIRTVGWEHKVCVCVCSGKTVCNTSCL